MAEGFIVRRGGPARYYEGEQELSAAWNEPVTVDVGFSPRLIAIDKTPSTYFSNTIRFLVIAFDDNDTVKGCVEVDTSTGVTAIKENEDNFVTVEKTATGVIVTGSTNWVKFGTTYRIFATG